MPRHTDTKDRLIESARDLFWEKGFAATSMSDLLAHSEVNSGSFYHFFESKDLRANIGSLPDLYRGEGIHKSFNGHRVRQNALSGSRFHEFFPTAM